MHKRYVGLLIVGALFGFFGVLIHWSALMFGDYFQVAVRNGLGFLFLLPILFLRKSNFSLPGYIWKWTFLYAALTVFSFTFITLAFLAVPIKTVLAVRYLTSVVGGFLLSVFFFREQSAPVGYLSVLLACAGIALFAYPYIGFITAGVIYAALAAGTFLVSNMIIKKVEVVPEVLMAVEFSFIAVFVSLFVFFTNSPTIVVFHPLGLIAAVAFGALLIIVTYLIIYGFRKTNFNIANIILTSEIFFGLLFGYILLSQSITLLEFTGIMMIFIAAVLPNFVALVRMKFQTPKVTI